MSASRREGFQRSRIAACAGLFLALATLPVALVKADDAPPPPPTVSHFVPVPCDPSFLGMSDMPEDMSQIVGPAQNVSGGW